MNNAQLVVPQLGVPRLDANSMQRIQTTVWRPARRQRHILRGRTVAFGQSDIPNIISRNLTERRCRQDVVPPQMSPNDTTFPNRGELTVDHRDGPPCTPFCPCWSSDRDDEMTRTMGAIVVYKQKKRCTNKASIWCHVGIDLIRGERGALFVLEAGHLLIFHLSLILFAYHLSLVLGRSWSFESIVLHTQVSSLNGS